MSALALAFAFNSCEQSGNGGVNLDNVTEDGFYVAGPATGATALAADYMMAAGLNEAADVSKGEDPNRSGMFEKYVALEAGKEFYLVLYTNGEETKYGANLETFDVSEKGDNPRNVEVKRGILEDGTDAPSMTVAESGLYHIILDLNEGGDLAFGKQIVVAEYSIHFQTQWRFRQDSTILLASRDVYEPYCEDVPEDWQYDLKGRPDELSSVFDVQAKALKAKMKDAVVTECRLSPVNDMVIFFSNGVIFEQFMPASRKDEEWRLIDYKKDEYIVCYAEDGPFPLE